jgi:hypothetical protein
MKTFQWLLLISAFIAALPLSGNAAQTEKGQCNVGPLEKTFGNAPWLLYSCTHDKNLVIVSASNSPALPFVFCFCMQNGSYQLTGEGTGKKEFTHAAFEELKKLTESDIAKLIEQTKSVGGGK